MVCGLKGLIVCKAPRGHDLGAPPIDGAEQKQPDNINEMPIPSSCFKSEMMFRFKMALFCPEITNDEKCRPNNHMRAVEARCHVERRAIDAARESKRCIVSAARWI